MRFFVDKQILKSALDSVLRAVPTKPAIPVLDGVLLALHDGILRLTGYDLELGIITEIHAESSDSGSVIIGAKLLSGFLSKLPNGNIEFYIDDKYLVQITAGKTMFSMNAAPADGFPALPDIDTSDSVSIPEGILKNMIVQTLYAVSTCENKPILTGELFELSEDKFTLAAVDGYRLTVRNETIRNSKIRKFVVPASSLKEVATLLSDVEKNCEIFTTRKHIAFKIGDFMVVSRLLEGDFHDYRSSIPKDFATTVTLSVRELAAALERCSLLITERSKAPVKCLFEGDSATLHCETLLGKVDDIVAAEIVGPSVEIGFNVKFLLDALKNSGCDKVRFCMNSAVSPLQILPPNGGNFLALVLPVRLKK